MTRRQQVTTFWVAALVLLIVLLVMFRQILLPFVAGAAIAYALDPVADWFVRRLGVRRVWAALLILAILTLVFAAIAVLLFPLLLNQLIDFTKRLPLYVVRLQELFGPALDSDWARFLGIDPQSIRTSLTAFIGSGAELTATLIGSIWTGGRAIVDILSLLVVTPFVAFYLLRDWDQMLARIDRLLPLDQADEIRGLALEIDRNVAAFVRRQLLVGFLLGIIYAAGLVGIGLNYGLLIGLASGILSVIPYLGFTIGLVLAIAIALVQFWPNWIWVAATVLVFLVGTSIEGYILQPRLIGRSVGLPPVWLIFSFFAFGLLFGFAGLLIAIPAAAAIGVLLRFAIERYRASPLFRGNGPSGRP
jgi:predicted PurR-regulated permease PerM